MKTEVKFRELPEKVQGFLLRTIGNGNDWIDSDNVRLNWLHNIPEWTRATDDERLAYAEWRYPVGTKIKSVYGTIDVVSNGFYVELHCVYVKSKISCSAYSFPSNEWASLISEPEEKQSIKDRLKGTYVKNESVEMGAEIVALYMEAGFKNSLNLQGKEIDDYYGVFRFRDGYDIACLSKSDFTSVLTIDQLRQIVRGVDIKEASPSAQQEFVKANPGMQHVEEPKAGDMVEVSDDGIDWKKYTRCTHTYRGIKRLYDGHFICENQDGFISAYKYIRLPQKSEVESKAKEILETWIDFGDDAGTIEVVTNAIKSAIKWGQANPDKI